MAKGSEGTGVDDLKNLSKMVTCERLGPVVVAAIDRFNAEAAKRAAMQPNSPELVRAAQSELIRLGCLTTQTDGTLNSPTKGALVRYLSIEGQPTDNPTVNQDLVTELSKHTTRVCPIECKTGETPNGDSCVVNRKPATAPATASKSEDDNNSGSHRKQVSREQAGEQQQPRRPKPRMKLRTSASRR